MSADEIKPTPFLINLDDQQVRRLPDEIRQAFQQVAEYLNSQEVQAIEPIRLSALAEEIGRLAAQAPGVPVDPARPGDPTTLNAALELQARVLRQMDARVVLWNVVGPPTPPEPVCPPIGVVCGPIMPNPDAVIVRWSNRRGRSIEP